MRFRPLIAIVSVTMLFSVCMIADFVFTPATAQVDLQPESTVPPRPTVTPRPTSTPRPTITPNPTATTTHSQKKRSTKTAVATLLLNVRTVDARGTQDDLRSVVQWQGESGEWYDVENWRGSIVDGRTVWWVEERDWGTGPFRWVVYQAKDDLIHGTSAPFMLPNEAGDLLLVEVTIN